MRTITSLGSFAVKNDGSEDFRKYVLEPLNEVREKTEDGKTFSGFPDWHYGAKDGITQGWTPREIPDVPILTVSQVKEFLSGTGEDLVASVPNDSSPIVSHPSGFCNSDEQIIKKVKHGLWQLSLGTDGFEEPSEFSKYVVNKAKELISLLNSLSQSGRSNEQEWISVEERLPELPPPYEEDGCLLTPVTSNCLVYDGEYVYEKSFGVIAWEEEITHWMPLPKPPKS